MSGYPDRDYGCARALISEIRMLLKLSVRVPAKTAQNPTTRTKSEFLAALQTTHPIDLHRSCLLNGYALNDIHNGSVVGLV